MAAKLDINSELKNINMRNHGFYDSLEDDVFDGQLGLDEWDTPRILIECSVIGGKYTSVM
jgi:hypothetical protein